ncbi:hypothetical protein J6590_063404 [Homalodisca vitripennis]|nr:hypothetical protein J6590_063404 [Homalodisca vitripennis]
MLKRENVGLASTCNSVGQTAGYFLGYVVFIALESADFCNTYLRTEHQPEGVVTLPNFLYYMGGIFLLSTTLVALFKREAPDEDNGEQDKDIKGTYQQLLRIVRLPAVRTLALILLTCKVSFCACDAIAGLKLVEAGVPREQFAMVALFLIPLQVSLPLLLTRYLVSDAPMDVYTKAIPYRLAFNLLAAAFVWLTPHLITKDHIPFHYYVLLILLYGLHQITLYSMFVSQLSFFARISDPNMGGTYMTLLNTLANLGTSWPNSLILLFVDGFSSSYCSNDPDNNCSCASLIEKNGSSTDTCGTPIVTFSTVVSRSVLHEHLSGKRNNSLPLIFVKICQCEVYFRARLDDSSVSARWCLHHGLFTPSTSCSGEVIITGSSHYTRDSSWPLCVQQCTTGAGECVKWLDGFYVLIVLCTLYGVVWMRWGRHTVHELQRRGDHHWKLSLHKR